MLYTNKFRNKTGTEMEKNSIIMIIDISLNSSHKQPCINSGRRFSMVERFHLWTAESPETQWVTMREVPQRLASPSDETPQKKKKKKSDECINHFIQLNLELLNTGIVHSLIW